MAKKRQNRAYKQPKAQKKIKPMKAGMQLPRTVGQASNFGLKGIPLTPPPYGPPAAHPLVFAQSSRSDSTTLRFALKGGQMLLILTCAWFLAMQFGGPIARELDERNWFKRTYCLGAAFTDFAGRSGRYLTAGSCTDL